MHPRRSLSQKFAQFAGRMESWVISRNTESSIGDEDFVKLVADRTGSQQEEEFRPE